MPQNQKRRATNPNSRLTRVIIYILMMKLTAVNTSCTLAKSFISQLVLVKHRQPQCV